MISVYKVLSGTIYSISNHFNKMYYAVSLKNNKYHIFLSIVSILQSRASSSKTTQGQVRSVPKTSKVSCFLTYVP